MAIWPFRRMGRRKRPPSPKGKPGDPFASNQRASATIPNTTITTTITGSATPAGPHGVHRKLSRRGSNRKTAAHRRASTKDSATFEKRLGEKTGSDLSRMDTAGTSDAEGSPHRRRRSDELTALPVLKELGTSPHLRPITRDYDGAGIPYDFSLDRHSSSPSYQPPQPTMPYGPGSNKMQRAGSNKRSATGPPHVGRKLSKRRKDEQVREEEIRAMSSPRHQSLNRNPSKSGSILRRDSRKQKSGLTRHFSDRPTSNISLPFAESIHSSMSSDSGNNAVALSAFHVFAPRPSIRLSSAPNSNYGLQRSKWAPTLADSPPPREMWRAQSLPLATEEVLSASRTIDHLADSMDASALRDLMERDARRKEKRRKVQEERLQQKLERRAERQRLRDQREQELARGGVPSGPPPPQPQQQPSKGLGIATEESRVEPPRSSSPMDLTDDTVIIAETPEPPSPPYPRSQNLETLRDEQHNRSFLEPPTPIQAARQDVSSIETPLETPLEEMAQAIHYSQTTRPRPARASPALSPPDSPVVQNRSEDTATPPLQPLKQRAPEHPLAHVEQVSSLQPSTLAPTERKASASTTERRPSDTEPRTRRRGSGWTAFFRRGTSLARRISNSKQSNPSQASFSNTSRESMGRQPLPPHLQVQPIRQHSGVQRTKSKFREDLPEMELPISPPDSRVQSPEVTTARAAAGGRGYLGLDQGRSSASPAFDDRSGRSISPAGPAGADSGLVSASLASIDSEASWLSGKPSKRVTRNGNRPHQNSVGSNTSYTRPGDQGTFFNASYEELGIPDEEYFHRLTPRAAERAETHVANDPFGRKVSSTGVGYSALGGASIAAEGQEELEALPEGAVVHSGVERHPTVIHHDAVHVKSREGLLNDFIMGEVTPRNSYIDDATPTTSTSPPRRSETALESDSGDDAEAGAGPEGDAKQSPESSFRYQRARSVDLGKGHVRHLSAGSAKLLEIPSRRNSGRGGSDSPGPDKMARWSGSKLALETETEEESEK